MRKILLPIFLLIPLIPLFIYCGGDDPVVEDPNEDPEPFQGFVIKIKAANALSIEEEATPAECTVAGESGETLGLCVTPFAVSGKVSAIAIGASNGSYRLLYGNELAVPLKTNGAIDHTGLDLSGSTLEAVGANFSGVGEEWWDRVRLNFTELDVRARLGGEFWTVRYVFVPTSPLGETAVDECIIDSTYREAVSNAASAYPIEMKRGEVLFCRRSDSTACSNDEFRFFDTVSRSFATSRPDEADGKIEDPPMRPFLTCVEDTAAPGGYRVNLFGIEAVARLSDPLRLVKESDGTYSYVTQSGLLGSGENLRVVFSLSLSNFVQLADMTTDTLSSASSETFAFASTLSVLSSLFHNATDTEAWLTAHTKFDTVSP